VLALVTVVVMAGRPETAAAPVATTPLGVLQGLYLKDGRVTAFLGVPYAAALKWPAQRFTRAAPAVAWNGTLTVTEPGPGCPQLARDGGIHGREDCLQLDVFAPATAAGAAVVVFIHPGGLTQGAAWTWDGAALAETYGVVVVCVNYRLGPLGFLQHEAVGAESDGALGGMNGITDQMEALRWVQHNVDAFGGDAARVTVWGESAGAQSVCTLAAAPGAAGLFGQAIIESGQCTHPGRLGWGPGNISAGLAAGAAFLAAVGAADIAALRAAPLDVLVSTPYGTAADGATPPIYYLDNHTFPGDLTPRALWQTGRLNARAVLMGFNTADGLVGWPFITASYGTVNRSMTESQVRTVADHIFGPDAAPAVLAQYGAARYARPDARILAAYRDKALGCPEHRMAEWAAAAGVATYTYLIGSPRKSGDAVIDWPTAYFPHGLELGALFDFTNKSFVPLVMTEETGARLRNYWMEFVLRGQPVDPSPGGVAWPRFSGNGTTSQFSPYLYLGPTVGVDRFEGEQLPLPDEALCAFWDSIH